MEKQQRSDKIQGNKPFKLNLQSIVNTKDFDQDYEQQSKLRLGLQSKQSQQSFRTHTSSLYQHQNKSNRSQQGSLSQRDLDINKRLEEKMEQKKKLNKILGLQVQGFSKKKRNQDEYENSGKLIRSQLDQLKQNEGKIFSDSEKSLVKGENQNSNISDIDSDSQNSFQKQQSQVEDEDESEEKDDFNILQQKEYFDLQKNQLKVYLQQKSRSKNIFMRVEKSVREKMELTLQKQEDEEIEKKKLLEHQNKIQNESQLACVFKQLKGREQMFVKFGFKIHQKCDDIFLNCIIQDLQKGVTKSSMNVTDLWDDKNMYKVAKEVDIEKDTKQINKLKQYFMRGRKIEKNPFGKIDIINKKSDKDFKNQAHFKQASQWQHQNYIKIPQLYSDNKSPLKARQNVIFTRDKNNSIQIKKIQSKFSYVNPMLNKANNGESPHKASYKNRLLADHNIGKVYQVNKWIDELDDMQYQLKKEFKKYMPKMTKLHNKVIRNSSL